MSGMITIAGSTDCCVVSESRDNHLGVYVVVRRVVHEQWRVDYVGVGLREPTLAL